MDHALTAGHRHRSRRAAVGEAVEVPKGRLYGIRSDVDSAIVVSPVG
jgi:hypothetical protein